MRQHDDLDTMHEFIKAKADVNKKEDPIEEEEEEEDEEDEEEEEEEERGRVQCR